MTAENINKLIKSAGGSVDSMLPKLFAKMLAGKDLGDYIKAAGTPGAGGGCGTGGEEGRGPGGGRGGHGLRPLRLSASSGRRSSGGSGRQSLWFRGTRETHG